MKRHPGACRTVHERLYTAHKVAKRKAEAVAAEEALAVATPAAHDEATAAAKLVLSRGAPLA